MPETNGWSRAEKYVYEELTRQSAKLESIDEKLTNLRVEVAQRGAIWGAISAAILTVLGWLIKP